MDHLSFGLQTLAIDALKKIDSRLSKSRSTILHILESANRPLTIQEIKSLSSGLAQSSLYRNLAVLENARLVHKIISNGEHNFYELDEHVLGHHHHLRCNSCGNVIDIDLDHKIEEILDKASKLLQRSHNYVDIKHNVDFYGVCSSCR